MARRRAQLRGRWKGREPGLNDRRDGFKEAVVSHDHGKCADYISGEKVRG